MLRFSSWITRIHFCERNEKSKKGFFQVIFLTPHALCTKSKMAASLFMFQFFNEVSNDDFQIYDKSIYRFSDEEVIPLSKATCS